MCQEVDNIHSLLEKRFKQKEFSSPLSLLKIVRDCNSINPYTVIQLKMTDVLSFGESAKRLKMNKVPFTTDKGGGGIKNGPKKDDVICKCSLSQS